MGKSAGAVARSACGETGEICTNMPLWAYILLVSVAVAGIYFALRYFRK